MSAASKYLFCILMFFLPAQIINAGSKKLDSLKIEAENLSKKDFDAAIRLCQQGVAISVDETDKAIFFRIEGRAWYFKGEFEKASQLYNLSVAILEKQKQPKELGLTFIELAKLYRKTKMLDAAERTYNRAFTIFTGLKDTINMSTVYNESGVVFEYRKDYNKAIHLYQQAYHLKQALKDTVGMAYSSGFIAGGKLLQNKLKEAEEFALHSLRLFQSVKDTFAIALAYTNLAEISTKAGQTQKSKYYLSHSSAFATPIQYLDLLANNFLQLSQIYKQEGRQDSALISFEKYVSVKDSLYNSNMQKTVLELNTKYETAQKDKELSEKKASLRMRNLQLLSSLVALLLIGLLFFSMYRTSTLKHKNAIQKTVIEQQDIAAKAIINAEESERVRMSATLHDGLGQLLSAAKMNVQAIEQELLGKEDAVNSYNRVMGLLDDSIKEMRSVSHQMMPGVMVRSGLGNALKELIEKIDTRALEINLSIEGLDEQYDQDIQIVLYRIFQECIHNVIKHARATKLYISLMQSADSIDVTIEDNGVGFDMNQAAQKSGIGLQNIRTRVNFLKGELDISTANGKGTFIALHIPLK
ncbi:MAG TPA: tetratricopeptide repeat protein [Niabella sp.]|nr:tetratricopeptide repeat protein [Niabella sp.]HOZ98107.1 tetratricopeptide repeat protein [Niabella sp.]HQW16149.1 tetratricopeptide repeat protein [Niabella sp.]HQX21361.1 tetratricopeptide repeat protein [Niabella sp.]HQX42237.1 tetratricopeptide repeat protein [Niabella sp.]